MASLRIFTVRGVPVQIHWTFLLLLGLIGFAVYAVSTDYVAVAYAIGMISLLFVFVLLHEMAHVAVARRFGVPTKSITLHPLGGISLMEKTPDDPKQEAMVSVAGPLVNVGFALLLAPFVVHYYGLSGLYTIRLPRLDDPHLLSDLFWLNVIMAGFNLLPAFPLDGGRVTRAILAIRMGHVKATRTAADLGRFFGIAFVLIGIFWSFNIFLVLIGIFVYFGASAEERMATTMAVFQGTKVADAMRRDFQSVARDTSVEQMVDVSYRGHQADLPVVEDDRMLGFVDRNSLSSAAGHADRTAADVMRSDPPVVYADDDLSEGFQKISSTGLKAVPVLAARGRPEGKDGTPAQPEDRRLVGLLTIEDLERAYLYNTQRDAVGPHTRVAGPFGSARKRRLPRAANARVQRETPRGEGTEEWVPVGRD